MPNYELGKIYEVVCLTSGKRYVGSTTKRLLCQRLTEHRARISQLKKGTGEHTSTIREVMEGGNYKMNLLEAYPCKTKDELNAKECEWIQKLDCVNRNGKGKNRENAVELSRKYNEEHKEEII